MKIGTLERHINSLLEQKVDLHKVIEKKKLELKLLIQKISQDIKEKDETIRFLENIVDEKQDIIETPYGGDYCDEFTLCVMK